MHQMSTTTEMTLRLFIAAVLAGSVLAVSGMASMQPAVAEKSSDKKGGDDKKSDDGHKDKKIDPNMDIKNAYRDGNNLVVQVKGVAGGTTPPEPPTGEFGQVYGYAFTLVDGSIWVLNAHWECHPQSGCHPGSMVSEWHAEQVTLAQIDGKTCVTSIFDETMDVTTVGHKGSIHVLHPAKIVKVQTVAFQLTIHPDTAPSVVDPHNVICVAYLVHQFDVWTPKTHGDNEERDD